MRFKFSGKRIEGVLCVLPEHEVRFEDEMANYNFSTAKSMKLKMAMGYDRHRIVTDGTCVSDLCVFGLEYLFGKGLLRREDVDALVLVTQSPDYFMPATSNVIQGRAGLRPDVLCLDINQGCCGYVVGLLESFMLLEQPSVDKVVLLNADVLSRKVSRRDRNSNPLIGDAAAITVVGKDPGAGDACGIIKMDGSHADALRIPAGGFRMPCGEGTSTQVEDEAGNYRSLENLVMKGDEVFNFVQCDVPPLVEELLGYAGLAKEDIDWYLFHQPNRFMLNKLADKLGVAREKMPSNIVENFGNSSGATIPVNMSFNLGDGLRSHVYTCCLSGFGVGLAWGAMSMRIGGLRFNEIVYF